jgi:hypothetical protein
MQRKARGPLTSTLLTWWTIQKSSRSASVCKHSCFGTLRLPVLLNTMTQNGNSSSCKFSKLIYHTVLIEKFTGLRNLRITVNNDTHLPALCPPTSSTATPITFDPE